MASRELENSILQRQSESSKLGEQLQRQKAKRRIAEAALRESEERYCALFESGVMAIAHIAEDGQLLMANQKLGDILGYPCEELLSLTFDEIIHPDDRSGKFFQKQDCQDQPRSQAISQELRCIRKDGSPVWVNLCLSLATKKQEEENPLHTSHPALPPRAHWIAVMQDISDRIALEKELAQQKQLFQAFFAAAPVGLAILDEQLRFVLANEAIAEINGLSVEAHLGKTLREVLPDTAPGLEPLFQNILSTGEAILDVETCTEVPGKSGERTWVSSQFALPGEDGKPQGIGAVIVDITERKQAEEATRKSEEQYRTLARNFPNGAVALFDSELRYTLFEGTELAKLGLSKELIEGKTLQEVFPPEFCAIVEPMYRAAFTGTTLVFEAPYKERKYLWHILPIRNERGEIFAGMVMAQNITLAKQVEEALRQQAQIIDQIREIVVTFDFTGTIVGWNKGASRLFGYAPSEAMGRNISFVYPPEQQKGAQQLIGQVIEKGSREVEVKMRRKSGENLFVQFSFSLMRDSQGAPVGIIGTGMDTSDRKHAEEELRKSEQHLRAVLENMPVMMCACDPNGNIIVWNRECERVTGYAAEVFGNCNGWELLYPDSTYRNAIAREWQERGNNFRNWEVQLTAKDGSVKTVSWSNISQQFPIPGWGGWAIGVDVTSRNLAEALLAGQNQILEMIAKAMPLPEILSAIARFIEAQSKGMRCSFLLLDADGIHLRHCAAPSLPESYNQAIDGIAIGPGVGSCGTAAYSKTQVIVEDIATDPLWVDFQELALSHGLRACWASPMLSSEETVLGTFAMYYERPRTPSLDDQELIAKATYLAGIAIERQQTEEKLLRHSRAMAAAMDGIAILDGNQTYIYMNEAYAKISGYDCPKPLLGQQARIFYDESQIARFEEEILPSLASKGQWQGEAIARRCDGSTYIQEISLTAIANGGAICIARDITERKRTEEALRQTLHELQQTQAQLVQTEKMSSLGQLVAGVAHEINNPVNFIVGNVAHAKEYTRDVLNLLALYQQHYPQPPDEIVQLAEEIDLDFLIEDLPRLLGSMQVGAERICQIVLSLRNFSRLDEADMKPVDIHEGIDSTLLILQNRLKERAGHSGIQVIKEYGDLPPVECYAGQMNQVFMNILVNAIDAIEEYNSKRSIEEILEKPSNITIRTSLEKGASGRENKGSDYASPAPCQFSNSPFLRIAIADNGPGMTEAVRSRLFDPFFTTKPVGKGTGLGLAISFQIVVEKHGGRLRCNSQPGQGAEFVIEIPLQCR